MSRVCPRTMNGEGLHRDLASTGTAIGRGDFLRYSFGVGALALFGCGGSLGDVTSSTPLAPTPARRPGTGGACSKVREETAGPFPGNGSNGANVLDQTGVVRGARASRCASPGDRRGLQRRRRPRAGDCDGEHCGGADRDAYCGRFEPGGGGRSESAHSDAVSRCRGQSRKTLTPSRAGGSVGW
jgi:hypothetical protein